MTPPVVTDARRADGAFEADLVFPPGADFFDGHFEDAPVLPGVAQVGAAARLVAEQPGGGARPASIRKLKFARVVRPGERLHLTLARRPDGAWSFAYACGGALCSSGIFVF